MLDETDLQIIALLNKDGRMPLTQIGSALGISHVTAGNRMEQMISRGVLEVRGYVDPAALGLKTEVVIGVKAELAEVTLLARKLASLDEVTFSAVVTGRYDIMISASFRSEEELLSFIQSKLSKIAGIRQAETFHILAFEKRRVQWRVPGPHTRNRQPGRAGGSPEKGDRVRTSSSRQRQ